MRRMMRHVAALAACMGFLLGIRNGKVTLWQDEDPHPVHVFDIRADSLPPADQVLLRRGIHLADQEELWHILENYLG